MNFLATNPSDAFNNAIWTLIIPALFVALFVAFLLRFSSKIGALRGTHV